MTQRPEHTCTAEPLACLMRRAATPMIQAALQAELDRRVKKARARVAARIGTDKPDAFPDLPRSAWIALHWDRNHGSWFALSGVWSSEQSVRDHIDRLGRGHAKNAPHLILEVIP